MFDKEYWDGVQIAWWQVLLTVLIVLAVIAAVIALITFLGKRKGAEFTKSTKDITYGAICIAASYALSFISIYSLPAGGTITPAAVLPMLIYCYYFGFRKSLIVSCVYMLLQLLQKPYIISPWSALLDYFLPYLALSLGGLFKFNRKRYETVTANGKAAIRSHAGFFVGAALYFIVRLFSHVLAGVLFWATDTNFLFWAGELTGAAAWAYSITYNLCYLVPDTIIALAAGTVLLSSKAFNTFMASSCYALQNPRACHENNERA